MRRFLLQKMPQFCGLKIGNTEIKLPQQNIYIYIFPQIFRNLCYTEFLVLELKSSKNSSFFPDENFSLL